MEIARVKTELNDSMDHEERMKQILDRIEKEANDKGMDGKEVRVLWKSLIKYIVKEQTERYPFFTRFAR